jgi:hypothetical protein
MSQRRAGVSPMTGARSFGTTWTRSATRFRPQRSQTLTLSGVALEEPITLFQTAWRHILKVYTCIRRCLIEDRAIHTHVDNTHSSASVPRLSSREHMKLIIIWCESITSSMYPAAGQTRAEVPMTITMSMDSRSFIYASAAPRTSSGKLSPNHTTPGRSMFLRHFGHGGKFSRDTVGR